MKRQVALMPKPGQISTNQSQSRLELLAIGAVANSGQARKETP
jgi:hypothetical protein